MKAAKPKHIFTKVPIAPAVIGESIARHSTPTGRGGHSMFAGQVRSDVAEGKAVVATAYTAYKETTVETCLFIFALSPHRKAAIDACSTQGLTYCFESHWCKAGKSTIKGSRGNENFCFYSSYYFQQTLSG